MGFDDDGPSAGRRSSRPLPAASPKTLRSWAGSENAARGLSSLTPVPGAIQIQIDHRGRIERQDLAQDQTAENGDAQRLAELTALPEADHQRQRAEQSRHG